MRVSIALCTFNGQTHLREQLDSLAAQTRIPDELVVCDDGSTDNTLKLVEAFAECAPFAVRVDAHGQRLGHAQNFARAWSQCSGDATFFCDQDDVWEPTKIDYQLTAFRDRPDAVMVAHDSLLTDGTGAPTGRRNLETHRFGRREWQAFRSGRAFESLVRLRVISGHTMVVSNRWRNTILPIPPGWMHDQWIAICSAALGPVVLLDEPLVRYRQHATQSVGGSGVALSDRLRQDRRLPAEHFYTQIAEWESLATRLRDLRVSHPIEPAHLRLVEEKIALQRDRAWMRKHPAMRWPVIAKELLLGRYRRLAQGWLTAARDVAG